ncbi:hypothetical protein BB559_002917 [Furculomyces boomerangus]|uniref:DnaJ homolog 1, mitochondrial n=1 Tax=Furculomyces boomerangus TaxID=61424 RepID=A0A2T9YR69_9FUNG|nr:hypothetical protein BB559_002917 [Furculomyces boomerangus]
MLKIINKTFGSNFSLKNKKLETNSSQQTQQKTTLKNDPSKHKLSRITRNVSNISKNKQNDSDYDSIKNYQKVTYLSQVHPNDIQNKPLFDDSVSEKDFINSNAGHISSAFPPYTDSVNQKPSPVSRSYENLNSKNFPSSDLPGGPNPNFKTYNSYGDLRNPNINNISKEKWVYLPSLNPTTSHSNIVSSENKLDSSTKKKNATFINQMKVQKLKKIMSPKPNFKTPTTNKTNGSNNNLHHTKNTPAPDKNNKHINTSAISNIDENDNKIKKNPSASDFAKQQIKENIQTGNFRYKRVLKFMNQQQNYIIEDPSDLVDDWEENYQEFYNFNKESIAMNPKKHLAELCDILLDIDFAHETVSAIIDLENIHYEYYNLDSPTGKNIKPKKLVPIIEKDCFKPQPIVSNQTVTSKKTKNESITNVSPTITDIKYPNITPSLNAYNINANNNTPEEVDSKPLAIGHNTSLPNIYPLLPDTPNKNLSFTNDHPNTKNPKKDTITSNPSDKKVENNTGAPNSSPKAFLNNYSGDTYRQEHVPKFRRSSDDSIPLSNLAIKIKSRNNNNIKTNQQEINTTSKHEKLNNNSGIFTEEPLKKEHKVEQVNETNYDTKKEIEDELPVDTNSSKSKEKDVEFNTYLKPHRESKSVKVMNTASNYELGKQVDNIHPITRSKSVKNINLQKVTTISNNIDNQPIQIRNSTEDGNIRNSISEFNMYKHSNFQDSRTQPQQLFSPQYDMRNQSLVQQYSWNNHQYTWNNHQYNLNDSIAVVNGNIDDYKVSYVSQYSVNVNVSIQKSVHVSSATKVDNSSIEAIVSKNNNNVRKTKKNKPSLMKTSSDKKTRGFGVRSTSRSEYQYPSRFFGSQETNNLGGNKRLEMFVRRNSCKISKLVSNKSFVYQQKFKLNTFGRNFTFYTKPKSQLVSSFSKVPDRSIQSQKIGDGIRIFQSRNFHSSDISKEDFYERLGVSKDATISEIKKSYYQASKSHLAKKYHPDVNKEPGSKEKFHKIQEAYDTLSDEQKRSSYDQFGTADTQGFGQGFPGGGFSGFYGGGKSAPSMDDIFSQIFGSGFGGQAQPGSRGPMNRGSYTSNGEDIENSIRISFDEAVSGTKKTISTAPVMECNTCNGDGMKKGAKATTCSSCKGTGQQLFSMGGFHVRQTCSSCGGSGSSVSRSDLCKSCNGRGVVQGAETVTVDIPAGCEDGMVIEMPGYGDAPIGGKGPRGSLYIQVRVSPSKMFSRKKSDIFYTAQIPLTTVLLGGEVTIPTTQGDVDVVVKPGTQPGDELRLRGKGMKKVKGSGYGDYYLKIKVLIPKNLNDKQKDLVKQLDEELFGSSNSKSGKTSK